MTAQTSLTKSNVQSIDVHILTGRQSLFWWLAVALFILVVTSRNLLQLTGDLAYLTARQILAEDHPREALWLLTQVQILQADQPYPYAMASRILHDLRDVSASQQQLDRARSAGIVDSVISNNLAIIKYEQHEIVTALELQQQASVAAFNVAVPHYNLGVMYWQNSNFIEAARTFREAIRIDPNWAVPYLYLAQMRMESDDFVGAEQFAHKALTLQPGFSAAHELVIQALVAQQKGMAALAAIHSAEAYIIDQDRVDLYRALAMRSTGEQESSTLMLEKLFRWTDDISLRRRAAVELRATGQP